MSPSLYGAPVTAEELADWLDERETLPIAAHRCWVPEARRRALATALRQAATDAALVAELREALVDFRALPFTVENFAVEVVRLLDDAEAR